MAKGFGKNQKRNSYKPYAPLEKREKELVSEAKKLGYKYNQDFLIDTRFFTIYATEGFARYFQKITEISNAREEKKESLRDCIKEVSEIGVAKGYLISREALMWNSYKMLYNSNPLLVNGLYEYPEEKMSEIIKKYEELDKITKPNEKLLYAYITDFYSGLWEQGYTF